jgi:hypothetical protein
MLPSRNGDAMQFINVYDQDLTLIASIPVTLTASQAEIDYLVATVKTKDDRYQCFTETLPGLRDRRLVN